MSQIQEKTKKFIFVMGPTASGKSAWALEQAQKYQAAIINCDSIQVYKELDIGSSKPSLAERKLASHYLYDYISYPVEMTAGQYCRDFYDCLKDIKEDFVFVVGGTGFYFQAIEQGMYSVAQIDEQVKQRVQQDIKDLGFEKIYRWILTKDLEYASKISMNDKYRIERAYELMLSENKTMTAIQEDFQSKKKSFPFKYMKVGFMQTKDELKELVQLRTGRMIKQGLIDEVRSLLDKGYSDWSPLGSVGYKEAVQYLHQNLDLDWLAENINKNTMKLIKKQRTWFQRDREILSINSNKETMYELDRFITDSGY